MPCHSTSNRNKIIVYLTALEFSMQKIHHPFLNFSTPGWVGLSWSSLKTKQFKIHLKRIEPIRTTVELRKTRMPSEDNHQPPDEFPSTARITRQTPPIHTPPLFSNLTHSLVQKRIGLRRPTDRMEDVPTTSRAGASGQDPAQTLTCSWKANKMPSINCSSSRVSMSAAPKFWITLRRRQDA